MQIDPEQSSKLPMRFGRASGLAQMETVAYSFRKFLATPRMISGQAEALFEELLGTPMQSDNYRMQGPFELG